MEYRQILPHQFPLLLKQISRQPRHLYVAGPMPPEDHIFLCVVGSRRYSEYGKEVCSKLIGGLRGYPIVIVSGLAIGIDSLSHEAAIKAGLKTIAFPGSGLSDQVLYPPSRRALAHEILSSGNTIMSQFAPELAANKWTFPVRNRTMAGMCHATLVIEGRYKSGTMITAKHALEFNRDVLIVPGSIFSELSYQPLKLMKDGAAPISSSEDLLEALGFDVARPPPGEKKPLNLDDFVLSPTERRIVGLLEAPIERDDLIQSLGLPISEVNIAITGLELKEIIAQVGSFIRLR